MTTIADVTTIDYSGDLRVDSLLAIGAAWNYLLPARTTLHYTFDTSAIAGQADGPTSEFDTDQQAAAVAILNYVAGVTGISFTKTDSASDADIHFGATDLAGASTAGLTITSRSYTSSGGTLSTYGAEAYVFLDNVDFSRINGTPTAGSAGYEVLLHEIGHALGLGHPFDEPYPLPAAQDNTANTVMSYTDSGPVKSTYQAYDLLTLQWTYGGDGLGGLYGLNSTYGPSLTSSPPPDPDPDPEPPPPPPPSPPSPPTDDYAASSATSGAVAVDGTRTGVLESAGDRDWFAVTLQAGGRYVFDLEGAPTGRGTLADPLLRLLSAGGTTLASDDDAGVSTNASLAYTAASGGVLYLEASSATAGGTGSYRLAVSRDTANRAPVALGDAFTGAEDTQLAGNVRANDSDPDGQSLVAALVTGPAHGTLTLQSSGDFTFTPAANWHGIDGFVYRVSDGSLSSTATATLTVTPVNDAPVASELAIGLLEDGTKSGTLPAAVDPDGGTLQYSTLTNPSHGTATVSAGGQYSYTPLPNFSGSDSFAYRVSDGALSAQATVSVLVGAVNDAPVAASTAIATDEDTPATGTLPPASDADGDPVTYAKSGSPSHGALTVGTGGQYTYAPAADYTGPDAFTYAVTDGKGGFNTYTVSVTVRPVLDTLRGTEAADVLADASGGDSRLVGLGGDDRLQGGSGDDLLDGGPGIDTAVYAGPSTGATVARVGTGWQVVDRDGSEGGDTLASVERLQFQDKAFELVRPAAGATPGYGTVDNHLFDPVYYLLDNAALVPTVGLAQAWQHYQGTGAAQGHAPNAWFDATYYEARWPDLAPLGLDDATLFRHFNLFGVWEGRSPGPDFDRFDGDRYLAENPDVAAYVDANVDDFLGSRSNGAIAHFVLYGAAESRLAWDMAGQRVSVDYLIDLGG